MFLIKTAFAWFLYDDLNYPLVLPFIYEHFPIVWKCALKRHYSCLDKNTTLSVHCELWSKWRVVHTTQESLEFFNALDYQHQLTKENQVELLQ